MKDIGFSPADILLPVESISMERWAVVACDQFTSEKEYWEEADRIAGDAPSTLRMILPECYLENDDREDRIRKIEKCMDDYLGNGIFRTFTDSYVLVRRDTESGTRYGLVGKLDLEAYDYSPDSVSLIRATEGTILSRISLLAFSSSAEIRPCLQTSSTRRLPLPNRGLKSPSD